jgi:hypothetical protein
MSQFLVFLESFVCSVKRDLSHRIEINFFTFFGFAVLQYFVLKRLGLNLAWATVLPTLLILLFISPGSLKSVDEAIQTEPKDISGIVCGILSLLVISAFIWFLARLIAVNPVSVIETTLSETPFSPVIALAILMLPLCRWLGKWGIMATCLVILTVLITKGQHAWITF